MATTTSSFSPNPAVFPYQGMPEIPMERSAIPRGEVQYRIVGGAVTIGAVGEDQRIAITCSFPPNFSYVLAEVTMKIAVGQGLDNDWQAVAIGNITDSTGVDINYQTNFEGINTAIGDDTTVVGPKRIYGFDNLPKVTILTPPGSTPGRLAVTCANLTLAGPVGTLDFFARFYQYDVTQTHHYAVNSPTLIR